MKIDDFIELKTKEDLKEHLPDSFENEEQLEEFTKHLPLYYVKAKEINNDEKNDP